MQQYGQKISVVSTTGAGKTTVAAEISKRLHLPHIELDAFYWAENWTGVPEPVFRERVETAINGEQWVADGNYSPKGCFLAGPALAKNVRLCPLRV
ncbi:MAG: hypothetical protein P8183_21760 [Anaerolineae bacterium]